MGELDLDWSVAARPEEKSAFAALAGLANLAGTGARTTLGLGQTRAHVVTEAPTETSA